MRTTEDVQRAFDRLPLSHEAKTLLLILAANGGEMDQADARREWERVMQLAPDDYAAWRERVLPLVRMHARRKLEDRR